MADLVKFVSKTELDAKKAQRREAREAILRKAKEDFDKKERASEAKRQRGEDVWMLPSLSKRLSGSSSEGESSKKKKHKSGKKKKKKKKKHKQSDSEEDEWVEKDNRSTGNVIVDDKTARPQRDSWMLLPMSSKNEQKESPVEPKVQPEADSYENVSTTASELGQHARELNPYWKNGGTGLPSTKTNEKGVGAGNNRAWFKRAYERAKQQAEDEGKSLEEVAAKRWGSLEKLRALAEGDKEERNASSERSSGRDKRQSRDTESRNDRTRRRDYRKDNKEDSDRRRDRCDRRDYGRGAFRKPDEEERQENRDKKEIFKKLMRPPEDESESWRTKYESYRNQKSYSKTSGRWRKTQEETETQTSDVEANKASKNDENIVKTVQGSSESESSSDESEKSAADGVDSSNKAVMVQRVTEADLNALGAKRLKAELMGNEDLAKELNTQLENMRKIKEEQEKSGGVNKVEEEGDNMVVLTRTDRAGNVVPVENRSRKQDKGKRRKRHKNVPTHDDEGKRKRYFCDDDDYDLNQLVRKEKMSTAEDQNATYARLAHKLGGQFDLDDKFESAAASKYTPEELEEKARQKAIREHQGLAARMENCKYCLDSAELQKHLIIAIGLKVYLTLPSNQSLCDGHCFLVPIMHHTAGTMVDEDVWSEIQIFKKGLTKLFEEMGKDVVFMEMNRNLNKRRHMLIECVPVDKEVGDLAPIYFKKAIQESDSEWSQNKKLIDTRKKDLRSSVPKGLPYFSVEFGLDGGFAHVIENENLVPAYFGKEIIGGMLELEPFIWKKPRKENFQIQKKKVLQFAEWWKPYDWTKRIKK